MIISAGVHGLILLLLFIIVAWRAPNPPHPEYGIELNFGLDMQGTGDVQPRTPVGSQETDDDEPLMDEPQEQTVPETEEVTEEPTEAAEVPTDPEVVSKAESPEVVEPKEDSKPKNDAREKTSPADTEVKPKEDPAAVYQPKNQSSDAGAANDKKGDPTSQGDDKKAAGDKGNPEGSIDSKALYGKQGGGGGGPSLDLAGWEWDHIPRANVPDNEQPGKIVFEIEVDKEGNLIGMKKLSGTVTPAAERAFREAIQRITFTKKAGHTVPDRTKGTISFVIRAE